MHQTYLCRFRICDKKAEDGLMLLGILTTDFLAHRPDFNLFKRYDAACAHEKLQVTHGNSFYQFFKEDPPSSINLQPAHIEFPGFSTGRGQVPR